MKKGKSVCKKAKTSSIRTGVKVSKMDQKIVI